MRRLNWRRLDTIFTILIILIGLISYFIGW
jgi:hypothetical protein